MTDRRPWALAAVAIAAVALLGWALDIPALKGVLPGLGTMKVNTAIGLICLALGLWPRSYVAWGAVAIGGLTLAQYLLGAGFGIDELLVADPDSSLTPYPGRMSPLTTFILVAGGLAIVTRGLSRILLILLWGALLMSGFVGLLYGVPPFQGIGVFVTGAAVHTLGAALLVFVGHVRHLSRTGEWPLPEAALARRLWRRAMLATIALPIGVGWLVALAARRGWLGPASDAAIMAVTLSVIGAPVAWVYTIQLAKEEARNETLRQALEASNRDLETRVHHRTLELDAARFRTTQLLHAAGEGIVGLDEAGAVTFCNPAGLRMLGHRLEARVFRRPHALLFHTAAHAADPEGSCRIQQAIDSGASIRVEDDHFERADGTLFPVEYSVTPLDPGGASRGAVIVFQDITERAAQREDLQKSNQELEAYASIASHDLQAPLRHIRGYVDLLDEKAGQLDADGRMILERMHGGVEKMQGVIDGLLAYSRLGSRAPEMGDVALDDVLAYVLDVAAKDLKEVGAEVHRDPLPHVHGDANRLDQVFQNLVFNAIRYRHPDRPLRIDIRYECDNAHVIRVTDNGQGFPQEYAERIFGMFERLQKRPRSGLGLGLSVVRRILEQHGGSIVAEGEPGKGATFIIQLPLARP